MKAIIVEDEKEGMDNLVMKLEKHCKSVEIIAKCFTGESAIKAIKEKKPDLVFLDIRLGTMTGFDVINQVQTVLCEYIIVTGHEEYAIKAIKARALDYLQKPVMPNELKTAVNDAKQKIQSGKHISRISVPLSNGFQLIAVDDITYCSASNTYTHIHLHNRKSILVTKLLKAIHEELPQDKFCRIHNKFVINLNYVDSFHRGAGGYVILKDGTNLGVPRPRQSNFLKKLERNMRYSG